MTAYNIPCSKARGLKIALVTDLHERDPEAVIALLKEAEPDLIAVAGDMFERHAYGEAPGRKKKRVFLAQILWLVKEMGYLFFGRGKKGCEDNTRRFFREAGVIAPIVMSLGNHEWYLTDEDQAFLKDCGVTVLDNADTELSGLRIGGLSPNEDREWVKAFAEKDGFKILLCHHPEYYDDTPQGIDLVLSGHAHGGQIRLLGRGLFAPGQGFFPKYHHGVYGRMVLSAGCANTLGLPRYGNPTEVVLITLGEKKQ